MNIFQTPFLLLSAGFKQVVLSTMNPIIGSTFSDLKRGPGILKSKTDSSQIGPNENLKYSSCSEHHIVPFFHFPLLVFMKTVLFSLTKAEP